VVDRCLAKAPEDRFATGEALAEALEEALEAALAERRRHRTACPPPGLPARLGEAQAAAVWRRAAQLQADALRREERSGGAGTARRRPRGADARRRRGRGRWRGRYRVADVAAAAEEAGISRQYVALALAELPRGTLPAAAAGGA
jgi:hypothetical protein